MVKIKMEYFATSFITIFINSQQGTAERKTFLIAPLKEAMRKDMENYKRLRRDWEILHMKFSILNSKF